MFGPMVDTMPVAVVLDGISGFFQIGDFTADGLGRWLQLLQGHDPKLKPVVKLTKGKNEDGEVHIGVVVHVGQLDEQ